MSIIDKEINVFSAEALNGNLKYSRTQYMWSLSIAETISSLIVNSYHCFLIQNSAGHEVTKPACFDQLGC